MVIQIRRAKPDEAEALTALAHAAKRHWGYPESWIAVWKPDLTITSQFVSNHEVFVAEIDNQIAGCCALVMQDSFAELEHMWIEPQKIGTGVGRALFEHACERAKTLGLSALKILADPNAEGFYRRMGAVPLGQVLSEIEGQPRSLPLMKLEL